MSSLVEKCIRYPQYGLSIASAATALGFTAAKTGTSIGFGIARGIATAAVGVAGQTLDHVLFGGNKGTGAALENAVSAVISVAEHVALAPILMGETITSTSLVAAQSSIDALSAMFPGTDEPSFSLASFVTLVRREWNEPALRDHLPEERYSVREIASALVAWGALQAVTQEWQEQKWFKALKEIQVEEVQKLQEPRGRRESRLRVTHDAVEPADGQLITADIGDTPPDSPPRSMSPASRSPPGRSSASLTRSSDIRLKSTLRRLSKMVLAGYGGAGLIFFGVSLTPFTKETGPSTGSSQVVVNGDSEQLLTDAVQASEQEATSTPTNTAQSPPPPKSYSWWNVLMGHHDQEIFEGYAFTPATVRNPKKKNSRKPTVMLSEEYSMPRYWVLTDHDRRQVVLVFRGTMSLNELAVDLTCDPEEFTTACTGRRKQNEAMPGSLPFQAPDPDCSEEEDPSESYAVHGGMLKMARIMGAEGKPVHSAVRDALRKNKLYELVLCGHSLGAGVAALLALKWADPKTCLTVPSSGLPPRRRVSVYCFAPPCLVSASLSKLSSNMITSFVYSFDIVSRLSLGSIRDITRAAHWLCHAKNGEDYVAVTKRALKYKAGYGEPEDPAWFLAVRKTLEANMHMANLYPPGRVLWAMRDGDLTPSHQLQKDFDSRSFANGQSTERVRLFEVLDVETAFSQIVFARGMLSSHLPDRYDRVLHELL